GIKYALSHSDRGLEHGLARKRWHDLMREAAQGRDPAGTVEQHVFRTDIAQRLELGADLFRGAIERPGLGGLTRIVKAWPLRQALGPETPRHACFDRLLVLSRSRDDVKGASNRYTHWIKDATACLHLCLEERSLLTDLLERFKLAQQQIVAERGHFFDGRGAASPHPQ